MSGADTHGSPRPFLGSDGFLDSCRNVSVLANVSQYTRHRGKARQVSPTADSARSTLATRTGICGMLRISARRCRHTAFLGIIQAIPNTGYPG